MDVDFFDLKLEKGCTILMCSDGLSNMVEDEKIQEIISNRKQILIRRAVRSFGKQIRTVVRIILQSYW